MDSCIYLWILFYLEQHGHRRVTKDTHPEPNTVHDVAEFAKFDAPALVAVRLTVQLPKVRGQRLRVHLLKGWGGCV